MFKTIFTNTRPSANVAFFTSAVDRNQPHMVAASTTINDAVTRGDLTITKSISPDGLTFTKTYNWINKAARDAVAIPLQAELDQIVNERNDYNITNGITTSVVHEGE